MPPSATGPRPRAVPTGDLAVRAEDIVGTVAATLADESAGGTDWNAIEGRYGRRVAIMNQRAIGRLAVAAAFAAAIVVSDPGGAGDVAAPIAVADGAAGAASNAIIIGDPGGDGPGPKVVMPGDPGTRPE